MDDLIPIKRTKEHARKHYDRISRFYDWIASSDKKYIYQGIEMLSIKSRETIIDIGAGTGTGLLKMSDQLNNTGTLIGLDLSFQMMKQAQNKLPEGGFPVWLIQGDAEHLPLKKNTIDSVLCSFTLELFPEEGISCVLNEVKRILKPSGRLVVVAMSNRPNTMVKKIYEIGHSLFPSALDCRPIPLAEILTDKGFEIKELINDLAFGLPIQTTLAVIE